MSEITATIYHNYTRSKKSDDEILCEIVPYVECLFYDLDHEGDVPYLVMLPDLSAIGTTGPLTLILGKPNLHFVEMIPMALKFILDGHTSRALLIAECWVASLDGSGISAGNHPAKENELVAAMIRRDQSPGGAAFWPIVGGDGGRTLGQVRIESASSSFPETPEVENDE